MNRNKFYSGTTVIVGLALQCFFMETAAQAGSAFPRFSMETLIQRDSHTTVTIGPDGHLYATTTNSGGRKEVKIDDHRQSKEYIGQVFRYELDPVSGKILGEELLATLPGPVNGFVFDPSSTQSHLVFYITVLNGRGHINRIHVKPLHASDPLIENKIIVDQLGRGGNHGMNNLVFAPDGILYANQGGRTFWGTKEDNHTAAVLAINLKHPDFRKGAIKPSDYSLKQLRSSTSPIQLFATGLRNPHGIVRHSNGNFYVTIHDPPRGPLAVGGPIKKEVVSDGPPDLVARLRKGAYYGHVNPKREEWVSYGGNPTSAVDPFEIPEYPVGIKPLPNYDLKLMLGTRRNHCISGIDEYLNGDLIAGYLYAQGAAGIRLAGIERFELDKAGNFTGFHEFLKGANQKPLIFNGVMDVHVTPQGWIYVANFGRRSGDGGKSGSIELLKPLGGNIPPDVAIVAPSNRSRYTTGEHVTFRINAQDYDGQIGSVTLSINGKDHPVPRNSGDAAETCSLTLNNMPAGHYHVLARASDNDQAETISDPIYLSIDSRLSSPRISSSPLTSAFSGYPWKYPVVAAGTPRSKITLKSGPRGMSVDSQSGEITWTPEKTGTFQVIVQAENGTEPADVQQIDIQVTKERHPEFAIGKSKHLVPGLMVRTFPKPIPDQIPSETQREKSPSVEFVDQLNVASSTETSYYFSGYLEAPESGRYEFSTSVKGRLQFKLGLHTVLDTQSSLTGKIPLKAGRHEFSLSISSLGVHRGSVLNVKMPGSSSTVEVAKSMLFRDEHAYGLNRTLANQPYLGMPENENDFLPETLSATGAFTNVKTLKLTEGAIPYDVNSPLWSDGALKTRWLFLPQGTQIDFHPTLAWSFPAGTVFVKHFALGKEQKRVETRLTVIKFDGSLYGVTYKWRDDYSDADLVTTGMEEDVVYDGGHRQTWFYPGTEDCMKCHTPASGYVLGMKTRQLNRDYHYAFSGINDNQLRALNHRDAFRKPLESGILKNLDRFVAIDDQSATLEQRMRSYLDSNCAHCHRVGGVNANWNAEFDTPLKDLGLLSAAPLNHMGLSNVKLVAPGAPQKSVMLLRLNTDKIGYRMPPVGRLQLDPAAVQVLEQWIESLKSKSGGAAE